MEEFQGNWNGTPSIVNSKLYSWRRMRSMPKCFRWQRSSAFCWPSPSSSLKSSSTWVSLWRFWQGCPWPCSLRSTLWHCVACPHFRRKSMHCFIWGRSGTGQKWRNKDGGHYPQFEFVMVSSDGTRGTWLGTCVIPLENTQQHHSSSATNEDVLNTV